MYGPRSHKAQLRYILDRIVVDGDCWLWTKHLNAGGYAVVQWRGDKWVVHRLLRELLSVPAPSGLDLDHLCRRRHCVNPDHTEIVTRKENLRRGASANRNKTHCKNGHPFTPENTRYLSNGWRYCRTCIRERDAQRDYAAERRARRDPQPTG